MAAGKQAYKAFPKHSKKVLILQMAKWWERKDGQVVCANQQVVNAIATFLDPLPTLPEFSVATDPEAIQEAGDCLRAREWSPQR